MATIRLTMAQAIVRYLTAQSTELDGSEAPLFPGVFAIFGHGNVTCLGEALVQAQARLPTWRGQNEQSMALAAVAYAKAMRRRQIMAVTTSIGPGCTNLVTAAGVALANRLPLLMFAGDTFASRLPDPVLQQVEHFGDPGQSAADALRAVTRYWDRITHPAQVIHSLPQAVAMMLGPGECGPAFFALPQDVQAQAFEYPESFFAPTVHQVPRPRADARSLAEAAALLRKARKPLLIAGGGVHYAGATAALAAFAERHRLPVCETVAGRTALVHSHPCNVGPIGVTGSSSANALAAEADLVLAIGTRLQDFTTGSWTVFGNPDMRLVSLNAARWDATKHRAHSVVGDALASLEELEASLADWQAPAAWLQRGQQEMAAWNHTVADLTAPTEQVPPSYAHVIGAVNRLCAPDDLALTAAGGLPGELNKTWRALQTGTFDCDYGYSCMGYEIAGGWGAKMARPGRDVIVFVGDGSYLMMNSDLYSSVLSSHKLIVLLCDNGGYAVIDRLQTFKGAPSFNNLWETSRIERHVTVDFAAHARSMGCLAESVRTIAELEAAFTRAKAADRTSVIVIQTHPTQWTPGDAWWETGVPEVSELEDVRRARKDHEDGLRKQRIGV